jgi:4-coumarate--CoA ligase
MPYKSRWTIDIPNAHLATLLLKSPTEPLSKTQPCFLEAARPESHYLTPHTYRLWSQRFAAGLVKSGLQTGDRVLLYSGNDLFFPVVFMGIVMAGGIFTGANPTYVARELAFQLKDSGAKYLLCAAGSLETGIEAARLAGLPREKVYVFDSGVYDNTGRAMEGCPYWGDLLASPEEGEKFTWDELSTPELADKTLVLNYSSGTTGRPKGVEITHKNYTANMLQYTHMLTLYPDYEARKARMRWLCFLPMYHAMAQTIFIAGALHFGTPVYIMPKFDFVKMLEYTQAFRITHLILVPPVVVMLAKHPIVKKFDLSSVESVSSGAAPLGREVCADVEKLWPAGVINVKQGWGMTEYVSFFLFFVFIVFPFSRVHPPGYLVLSLLWKLTGLGLRVPCSDGIPRKKVTLHLSGNLMPTARRRSWRMRVPRSWHAISVVSCGSADRMS